MTSPLAQTFQITTAHSQGQEGIFLTKIDLFFKTKDPAVGVTIELRMTNGGIPSPITIPFSRVHLPSSSINVSTTAATATQFTFPSPVFLKSPNSYALVVIPDGNSPEFYLWSAQVGETDVLNDLFTVTSDWGQGTLFSSTNDTVWIPIAGENLKFNLYRADFTTTIGTLTLTNKNNEYLDLGDYSANGFMVGEPVFKYSTNAIAGTISFSNASLTLTGNGTSFQTTFNTGSYIVLMSTLYPVPAGTFDVVQIASIANSTSMTLTGFPRFTGSGVAALKTPTAKVSFFDPNAFEMHLGESTTANSTFRFAAGDTIVGVLTSSTASVNTLLDKSISAFQPLVYRTAVGGTSIAANYQQMDSTYAIRDTIPLRFNDTTYNFKYDTIVASRSNEILNASSVKSVQLPITFTSVSSVISPVIDLQSTSLLWYKFQINNSDLGETGPAGSALAKYVSQHIILAEGQESEDLKVYVTAYQPSGSTVQVYGRFLNSTDPETLDDKAWTPLDPNSVVTCDPANRNDFKEYIFSVPDLPTSNTDIVSIGGVVSGTANTTTVSGISTVFDALTAGSTVVVTTPAGDYFVSQIGSVTSNTSLELINVTPWNFTGCTLSQFLNPSLAFHDSTAAGVTSYYVDGALFRSYKSYAVKIVLLTQSNNIPPRVKDIRALALTS